MISSYCNLKDLLYYLNISDSEMKSLKTSYEFELLGAKQYSLFEVLKTRFKRCPDNKPIIFDGMELVLPESKQSYLRKIRFMYNAFYTLQSKLSHYKGLNLNAEDLEDVQVTITDDKLISCILYIREYKYKAYDKHKNNTK
jgi:hypothetical protein